MVFFKALRIFVPDHKPGMLLRGYFSVHNNTLVIYFTKVLDRDEMKRADKTDDENVIYGCLNTAIKLIYPNWVRLGVDIDSRVHKLVIKEKQQIIDEDCVILLYSHDKIRYSHTITNPSEYYAYFNELHNLIKKENNQAVKSEDNKCFEPIIKKFYFLPYSMFLEHVIRYINLLYWLMTSSWKSKTITMKQRNLLFTIIVDIILGYIFLEVLVTDKQDLSAILMNILEGLVNSLYTLLKWLMGSPAGLKLNNAFNKMLGNYFSYHIQLWWIFLNVSSEKLNLMLQVYHYIGYLGLTFQAAFICDVVSLTTFHSYCIYVYAARLFNIQISGLVALLRLFVGRKHNPLRGGIDSCEYSNQELFVGTVAFTILLLLLPTTAMYYIVFTLFRLLTLLFHHILARLMYIIQTCPIYVTILWIINSPKIAGNMLLEVVSKKKGRPLVLRVQLLSKSLSEIVASSKPPVEEHKPVEWTNVFSNICSGKQIQ